MGGVTLIPAVCPKCGASLDLPGDLEKAHCMYCGTQIIIGHAHSSAAECKVCNGFGRIDICRACNGSGKCTWYMSSSAHGHSDITSFAAYGTSSHCVDGYCSACNGRGRGGSLSPCPFCGGTGKCPRCLGNKRCTACHGLGILPGPSGSMSCLGCGGKGHLEGAPPKAPSMSACPECGMPMAHDMLFCSRCGFVRGCPRCGSAWPKGSLMCPWCGHKKGGGV